MKLKKFSCWEIKLKIYLAFFNYYYTHVNSSEYIVRIIIKYLWVALLSFETDESADIARLRSV